MHRRIEYEARRRWPAPWVDAVADCVAREAVIGTPVAEYLPDRLVRGRLALVGDAAHVPTPMTGRGFAASLQDALDLAEVMAGGMHEPGVVAALRRYEDRRLRAARNLVLNGQQFSRSFARLRK
jgi:2-polyprenyl-6-methoxyphenol hydroxylase-like FAD-dependent oxidoreductase